MIELCAERHSDTDRQSFAERTRGRLKRRNEPHVRMALINGSEFAQRVELVFRRVSAFGHCRVKHGAGVAFGQDEVIAIRPFRIRRVVPHHVEKESDQDLHGRERSAGMAGFGERNHLDDLAPHLLGDRLKFGYVAGSFHLHLLSYKVGQAWACQAKWVKPPACHVRKPWTGMAKRRLISCTNASGVVKRMPWIPRDSAARMFSTRSSSNSASDAEAPKPAKECRYISGEGLVLRRSHENVR